MALSFLSLRILAMAYWERRSSLHVLGMCLCLAHIPLPSIHQSLQHSIPFFDLPFTSFLSPDHRDWSACHLFHENQGLFYSFCSLSPSLTKNVMTKGRGDLGRTFICKSLWLRGDLWPLELPGIWLKSRGRWRVLKTITSKGLIISWPSFSSSPGHGSATSASINPSESITTRPTQFRSVS